jgi:hypothetical protein
MQAMGMRRDRLFLVVALVVALAALAFVSCGGGGGKAKKVTPAAAKKAAPLVWPLTGRPDPQDEAKNRCAVTVKIDNTADSLPKYGVEQADVVYEEVVEDGYTRLAAIFNSQAPTKVGSVRSVRKTDQSLVTPIGGVFAYSGGAQYAIDSISTAPVVQLDESRAGPLMFRVSRQTRPEFTLYAHVDQMYGRCGKPKPPPPLFTYRKANAPVVGGPVSSVRVGFISPFAVTWTWDAPTGTWKRALYSSPETESGTPLAVKNVVVMTVNYVGGDPRNHNIGAEAMLTGEGKLQVFTGAKVITGTWKRPDRAKPAKLLDAKGAQIKLAPGPTWVELPDPAYAVTVTAPPTATTTTP